MIGIKVTPNNHGHVSPANVAASHMQAAITADGGYARVALVVVNGDGNYALRRVLSTPADDLIAVVQERFEYQLQGQ